MFCQICAHNYRNKMVLPYLFLLPVGGRVSVLACLRFLGGAFLVLLACILIAVAVYGLLQWTNSAEVVVMTDAVVNIFCSHKFWFNKLTVEEKATSNKVKAHIYLQHHSSSKVNQTTSSFQSRPLPYPNPASVYGFPEYLLSGSRFEINITANGSASPASVCQFTNFDDFNMLIDARSQDAVRKAEERGFCQSINLPTSNSTNFTSMSFYIHRHGYYYYAIAALSDDLYLNYTYMLKKRYYERDRLTPYDCSVVASDCIIKELTFATEYCVLVYIPKDMTNPTYFFKSELSDPIVVIVLVVVVILLIFFIFGVLHCLLLAKKLEKCFVET